MNIKAQEPPERPYVGATAIQDDRLFFGRGTDSEAVVDNLLAYRIVLLFSPSGAGKTSLIEAGVKPRLAKDFDILPTIRLNRKPEPGQIPENTVYNRFILSALLSLQTGADVQAHEVLPSLVGTTLAGYLEENTIDHEDNKRTLLIFDQFEELLASEPALKDEIVVFLEDLMTVLYDYRYWALFAMREDYLAKLEPYLSYFPDRLSTHYYLKLLDKDNAIEAVIRPAGVCKVKFHLEAARKLVDELSIKRIPSAQGVIEQSGDYVEPVQLQVVCDNLWDKPRPDPKEITPEDVSTLANIDTALADHYNRKVSSVAKAFQIDERGIRDWFEQQLISEQEFRQQTLAGTEAQYGMNSDAVTMLINAYLVREDTRLNITWYELAHDRLIRPVKEDNKRWKRANLSELQLRAVDWQNNGNRESMLLRGAELIQAIAWADSHMGELNTIDEAFLDASKKWRETHLSLLQRKAAEWDKNGRVKGFLAGESELEEAAAWAATHTDEITGLELEFLDASRKQAEIKEHRRREQAIQLNFEKKRIKSLRRWILALGVVAAIALVMFLFALISSNNAKQSATLNAILADTNAAYAYAQSTLASDKAAIAVDRETQAAQSDTLAQTQSALAAEKRQKAAENAIIALTALAEQATASAEKEIAQKNALMAFSRQVASQAMSLLERRPDLGILLGIEAYKIEPSTWEARSALLVGLQTGLQQNVQPYELNIPTRLQKTISVDINPNRKIVAWSGSDGKIILWDIARKTIRELQDPKHIEISSQAFSPTNPNLLVTGNTDNELIFWDINNGTFERMSATGKTQTGLQINQGRIRHVAFSPDGNHLAIQGQNPYITIWNVPGKIQERAFKSLPDFYWDLEYSPDNRYLGAAGGDNFLYVFDPTTGNQIASVENPDKKGRIYNLDWQPGSQIVAFGGSTGEGRAKVNFYNLAERKLLPGSLGYPETNIYTISYNQPKGNLLVAAGYMSPVIVWRSADGNSLPPLPEYGRYQNGLSFVDNFLAYLTNNTISVYEIFTPQPLGQAMPPAAGTFPIIMTGDSNELLVASHSSRGIALEDRIGGENEIDYSMNEIPLSKGIFPMVFTPDRSLLFVNQEKRELYHWSPGDAHLVLENLPATVDALAVNPEGDQVALGMCQGMDLSELSETCQAQVQIWNLETGSMIGEPISTTLNGISALAFNSDSSTLSIASPDGTLTLLDLENRQMVELSLEYFPGNITSSGFSVQGDILVTGTEDGLIYIWNAQTGQAMGKPFKVGNDPVVAVAISPDATHLYAAQQSGQLSDWDLDFDSWVKRACDLAGRTLTQTEWQQFLTGQKYDPACLESRSETPTLTPSQSPTP